MENEKSKDKGLAKIEKANPASNHMQAQLESLLSSISEEKDLDFPAELFKDLDINEIYNESKKIMTQMIGFKELMMMYDCAIKKIRTKFEILDTEFNVRYRRNPINFINTRLKSTRSIMEKMQRNKIPFSLENIEANINDAAGIRIICSYVDDIYSLSSALINQDDIRLVEQKDYIANPKPNGYRSMHLIVSTPIYFADQTRHIKAEVQIRTIAMDFWATLEHQLRYKNLASAGKGIAAELKECADVISETDIKMLDIRKKIEANAHEPTEEEILFEKMSKLNFSL